MEDSPVFPLEASDFSQEKFFSYCFLNREGYSFATMLKRGQRSFFRSGFFSASKVNSPRLFFLCFCLFCFWVFLFFFVLLVVCFFFFFFFSFFFQDGGSSWLEGFPSFLFFFPSWDFLPRPLSEKSVEVLFARVRSRFFFFFPCPAPHFFLQFSPPDFRRSPRTRMSFLLHLLFLSLFFFYCRGPLRKFFFFFLPFQKATELARPAIGLSRFLLSGSEPLLRSFLFFSLAN